MSLKRAPEHSECRPCTTGQVGDGGVSIPPGTHLQDSRTGCEREALRLMHGGCRARMVDEFGAGAG